DLHSYPTRRSSDLPVLSTKKEASLLRQFIHLISGFPLYPFSHTNQAYATALDGYFSNSQFMAHISLDELTYTVLGGCFKKNCFLLFPSKNCSFKNMATFLPGFTLSSAFYTNCNAYLYGGFVIISPSNSATGSCKKSTGSSFP